MQNVPLVAVFDTSSQLCNVIPHLPLCQRSPLLQQFQQGLSRMFSRYGGVSIPGLPVRSVPLAIGMAQRTWWGHISSIR